ncbi:uncharacterized protein LOC135218802 [Macrobrachium nipponense]|uniref:uncharacterized protein LOC135218802 n=1 Tax=Macrobrachium nipponense TaxID=159736 RepID=UPI0030C82B4E
MKSLEYLGYVISENGLHMQEGKIKAIVAYPAPNNLKALRKFLGMVGYYRPFIKGFATIAKPLTDLTKKDVVYEWKTEEERAFPNTQEMMTRNPNFSEMDFTMAHGERYLHLPLANQEGSNSKGSWPSEDDTRHSGCHYKRHYSSYRQQLAELLTTDSDVDKDRARIEKLEMLAAE